MYLKLLLESTYSLYEPRIKYYNSSSKFGPQPKNSPPTSSIKVGFKFIGATICYAFMQAAGMINDYVTSCFRFKEVNELSKK